MTVRCCQSTIAKEAEISNLSHVKRPCKVERAGFRLNLIEEPGAEDFGEYGF